MMAIQSVEKNKINPASRAQINEMPHARLSMRKHENIPRIPASIIENNSSLIVVFTRYSVTNTKMICKQGIVEKDMRMNETKDMF